MRCFDAYDILLPIHFSHIKEQPRKAEAPGADFYVFGILDCVQYTLSVKRCQYEIRLFNPRHFVMQNKVAQTNQRQIDAFTRQQ